MTTNKLTPALGILALLATASSAFGQTTFSIANADFAAHVGTTDNTGAPSGGANSTHTASVGSAFTLGNNVTVHSALITVTPGADGFAFSSDVSMMLSNSGFPGYAFFNFSDLTTFDVPIEITSDTNRSWLDESSTWVATPIAATLLAGSAIPAGSVWTAEAYMAYDSDPAGSDALGTGISFTINALVPNEPGNWETFEATAAGGGYTGATGTITADREWTYQNNSPAIGTTSWTEGVDVVFGPHDGLNYMSANYNSCASGLIDNWLISEEHTFNNGDEVSFWACGAEGQDLYPDRLHLKFSPNGSSTNVAGFTTVLASVNPGLALSGFPETWTKYTGTITGLGGPTSGRIAFHYDVPDGGAAGANSNYFGIDDISITSSAPANQVLSGSLLLNNTVGSFAYNADIAYQVKQGATTLSSGTISASMSSTAMTINVPSSATGAAHVILTGGPFLREVYAVNLTGANQNVGTFSMRNGNVVSDVEVGPTDIDAVIAAFGEQSGVNANCDRDAEVGPVDIDVVVANFGEQIDDLP